MEIQFSNPFGVAKKLPPANRPVRFSKIGENADHPLTIRMREIKESLGMTTNELARAVNRFELEYGRPKPAAGEPSVSASYMPLKPVLLSSYLQGWVMQTSYMEAVHKRLEAYLEHARKSNSADRPKDIKTLMDGWFSKLGIDPKDEVVSPHRELARRITDLCKRPVVIDRPGIFQVGTNVNKEFGWYAINEEGGASQQYLYRKVDGLLIEDRSVVAPGDVVQYSKEIVSPNPAYEVSQENPINQSTFYRWYRSNKMPRARVTIDLIDDAVKEAAGS